jgi:hypothetical protein
MFNEWERKDFRSAEKRTTAGSEQGKNLQMTSLSEAQRYRVKGKYCVTTPFGWL